MRSLTTRLLMALICCAISFNTWSQNMVTFNVDMSCSGETFSTVYLTGPSLGWCADCVPLSDPDMDDVWTVSMDLPNGNFCLLYTSPSPRDRQ